ncbi:dioxygenase [Paenibacillus polymyxa]|uniref:mannitol dehydrogenase family protein n=1 Tax=Paenibacillus polymyxa TaxID=1406 RepID=UPI00042E4501|nr:mannitol dehydrogenase family protein [Paenibacillus polymyxa]AHM66069.1 mannitol dehydrogenase [Paenibacillus polymyxa SQR-21]AIY11527.1 dioxygenase [Paenibacillus polymyxa]SEK09012.1 fructuronate reductase [Paenibacillus polymyxa]
MLQLDRKGLLDKAAWEAVGIELPKYDLELVAHNTRVRPQWVHFGAGNIFRGFVANAQQQLLNSLKADTGIIVAETFDFEMIDKAYKPYDNLTLLVLMSADGKFHKSVVASIVESLATEQNRPDDYLRLLEVFENPTLQIASFTVTEKGYGLTGPDGKYLAVVERDLVNGPEQPVHVMSIATSLAYRRYLKGQHPMTLVSMDNCSHNGDLLKDSMIAIAKEWTCRGLVEKGFADYLQNEEKITFPLTMIDKITPRPSLQIQSALRELGLADMEIVVTSRHTYTAPFVNAEVSEYLVIEDKFTNGRPALEEAGIIFTNRDTVDKVEKMKVTTCLNPLHTALALSGCLLGYQLIADEMNDYTLRRLVETIGNKEGLPVVVDPGIIQPQAFINEILQERFANPYIPDTPQRIATDTSQKMSIRFGETIKSYVSTAGLDPTDLTAIPLTIAIWCRYLLGVDDQGTPFTLSPDPLLDTLQGYLQDTKLGDQTSGVRNLLEDEKLFGVRLYEIGLGDKIEAMFHEMLSGPGAVRSTIEKYVN